MIDTFNNITVYHGSYIEVQQPDLNIGIYGEIGSEVAGKTAISNLEPENLKNQFCFRSDKAIEKLHFVKSEKVDLVKGR